MECPECSHENTEGAWLCINCGEKLPRPETSEAESNPETTATEEPSRFAPKISENLRKLRDQTERERVASQRRSGASVSAPTSGTLLGIPLAIWAVVAVVLIAFVIVVSNLQ